MYKKSSPTTFGSYAPPPAIGPQTAALFGRGFVDDDAPPMRVASPPPAPTWPLLRTPTGYAQHAAALDALALTELERAWSQLEAQPNSVQACADYAAAAADYGLPFYLDDLDLGAAGWRGWIADIRAAGDSAEL